MKLVAKAKPVKIRIKSGGEEHSSLDSLKMNFCIDDVRELLDGRLSRWLRQQNEILLAEEIDKFESRDLVDSDENCLSFIKLLFSKELEAIEITSLFDLAKHWCIEDIKYKRNGKSLFKQRLLEYNLEAAKYAYKNGYFPEMWWGNIFSIHKREKDPETLYILGKIFFEGSYGVTKNLEEGYKLIKEAASYGWEEAIKFELEQTSPKVKGRFSEIDKEKLLDIIISKWPHHFTITDYREFNEKEKLIFRFLFKCKQLFDGFNKSLEITRLKAKEAFKDRKGNLLECEMRTIIAILGTNSANKRKELEPIKDIYPPATCLYYQGGLVNGEQFYYLNQKHKIAFIVQHLFDFD